MKIIKKGNPSKIGTFEFDCRKCGCIFEAKEGEYVRKVSSDTFFVYCDCPCCGNTIRRLDMETTMESREWSQNIGAGTKFEKRGLW